jgi:hypothetical protein
MPLVKVEPLVITGPLVMALMIVEPPVTSLVVVVMAGLVEYELVLPLALVVVVLARYNRTNTISGLFHRMVLPTHSPRQFFPSAVAMSISLYS